MTSEIKLFSGKPISIINRSMLSESGNFERNVIVKFDIHNVEIELYFETHNGYDYELDIRVDDNLVWYNLDCDAIYEDVQGGFVANISSSDVQDTMYHISLKALDYPNDWKFEVSVIHFSEDD